MWKPRTRFIRWMDYYLFRREVWKYSHFANSRIWSWTNDVVWRVSSTFFRCKTHTDFFLCFCKCVYFSIRSTFAILFYMIAIKHENNQRVFQLKIPSCVNAYNIIFPTQTANRRRKKICSENKENEVITSDISVFPQNETSYISKWINNNRMIEQFNIERERANKKRGKQFNQLDSMRMKRYDQLAFRNWIS